MQTTALTTETVLDVPSLPYDVEETVDLTVELHPTIQVPAINLADLSSPATPVPISLYEPALLLVYREIASHRESTGAPPLVVVLNPLTRLEVVLATGEWDSIQDPADGIVIALISRLGLRPDEVVCVEAPQAARAVS
jgi:hypothetical protein